MSVRPPVQLRFGDDLVRRGARAADWREAVGIAGALLIDAGAARPGYSARLVDVIDKYGPYMVIAPNLALVHAQPGPDSLEAAMCAVTFPDGVNFGHAHFDPVGLVIGLVTTNASDHLGVIAAIATALEQHPDLVSRAVRTGSTGALVALLSGHLPQPRPGEA